MINPVGLRRGQELGRGGGGAGARSGRLNVQAGLKRLNRRSSAVRQGGCVHRAMLKA